MFLTDLLPKRKQRVILYGQYFYGLMLMQEYPKVRSLDLCFFFVYRNGSPNGLNSNAKMFADDISQFSAVRDKDDTARVLSDN